MKQGRCTYLYFFINQSSLKMQGPIRLQIAHCQFYSNFWQIKKEKKRIKELNAILVIKTSM